MVLNTEGARATTADIGLRLEAYLCRLCFPDKILDVNSTFVLKRNEGEPDAIIGCHFGRHNFKKKVLVYGLSRQMPEKLKDEGLILPPHYISFNSNIFLGR